MQCACQCEHDERTLVLTFTPFEWAELIGNRDRDGALDSLTGFAKARALAHREVVPAASALPQPYGRRTADWMSLR